jgi:hypothetical protein
MAQQSSSSLKQHYKNTPNGRFKNKTKFSDSRSINFLRLLIIFLEARNRLIKVPF